jgi:hypothetical protein
MASNRFWHIVSVVKEQSPPVLQKGTSTAQGEYDERVNMSTGDYRFPQAPPGFYPGGLGANRDKAFIKNELRISQCLFVSNQCWTYCDFEISLAAFAERK